MKTLNKTDIKLALIFVSMCFSSFVVYGQEHQNSFWNNVRYGGGLGLGFGNGYFSGTLTPSAIYEFNNQFAIGLGLNATYASQKDLYKSTILGGSIVSFFNPIEELQLSIEFEELHFNRNYDEKFVSNIDDKFWYPALYLGAGYRTGNVTFGIRYDVLYNKNKSAFSDPWMPFFRVYF